MRGKSARVLGIIRCVRLIGLKKKAFRNLLRNAHKIYGYILSAVLTPYFSVFRKGTLVFIVNFYFFD